MLKTDVNGEGKSAPATPLEWDISQGRKKKKKVQEPVIYMPEDYKPKMNI